MINPALHSHREEAADAREDRYAQLRDMQTTVNACTALMFVVFSVGTFFVLRVVNRHLAVAGAPAMFTFVPGPAIWMFFPLFGGMTLSWYLTLFVWSLFGFRSTATEYREWARHHAFSNFRGRLVAMNSQRFFFSAAWLLALPIGIATVLALNQHTVFTKDEIRVCGYAFRPCAVHPYSEIRRVTAVAGIVNARYNTFEKDPFLVLDFASDDRWSSLDANELHRASDGELAAFVYRKTGLVAGSAGSEKGIPPLPPR